MDHHALDPTDFALTRRDFLQRTGMGFGAAGLANLLGPSTVLGAEPSDINPMAPKQPHFPAKAKRVVHIFFNGGLSHVDSFDPKPLLDEYHGKKLPTDNLKTERPTGGAYRSPFEFKQ